MPTTTTTYSFNKPVVGADEDDWGGYLNGNWDSVDDLLDGTTPVTGIDINSGTLDGVTIGGTTAGAGTFTTLTATTSITGTLATAAQPNVTSLGTLTGLTVSGSTSLAGASTSADITFGDNDKAIFGAGSDLSIYHDSATGHSIITESGGGALQLRGENLILEHPTTGNNYLLGVDGASGYVKLYHNGVDKLATTSTGIDVTGTVTADGLTVSTGGVSGQVNLQSTSYNIQGGTTYGDMRFNAPRFRFYEDSTTLRVNIDGGDISFYEDTGTTAKFFWDASAESLGIGTTSPSTALDIETFRPRIEIKNTDTGGGTYRFVVGDASDANYLAVYDTGASQERMRIDSSGNVGIGTSSPSSYLHIKDSNGGIVQTIEAGDSSNAYTKYINSTTGSGAFTDGFLVGLDTDESATFWLYEADHMKFATNNTERMRIDSSGNLLVGTTDASQAANTSGNGTVIGASGGLEVSRDSFSVAYFNKTSTSDGNVIEIRKQGTTVGSIGSVGGSHVGIGSGDSGVFFRADTDSVQPYNPAGTSGRDAAIDLGYSTNRFKDLYLSGGVYLGGTGSANLLDDYEESSFGLNTASDSTGSLDGNSYGYYVKVGSMVTVQVVFQCTANFTSNKIGDLPFVPINHSTVISTLHGGGVVFYGSSRGFVRVSNNDTKMYFTDTSGAAVNPSTSNDPFRFTLTYRTS